MQTNYIQTVFDTVIFMTKVKLIEQISSLNPFSLCRCLGTTLNPAGGMVSSAEDLLNWLIFQTSEGRNSDGDVVLDEEVWKETTRPNIPSYLSYPTQPETEVTYSQDNHALGWFTGYYRGMFFRAHIAAHLRLSRSESEVSEDKYALRWFLGYYRAHTFYSLKILDIPSV